MPGFCASVTPASVHVNPTWLYVFFFGPRPHISSSFTFSLDSHVYYMSWLLGFSISGCLWLLLNAFWPPPGVGETDEKDLFLQSHDDIDTKSLEKVDVETPTMQGVNYT